MSISCKDVALLMVFAFIMFVFIIERIEQQNVSNAMPVKYITYKRQLMVIVAHFYLIV
jgi:hypothetical protein